MPHDHTQLPSTQNLNKIKLLITDIDSTLVHPRDPSFYDQYGRKCEQAIADYFHIDQELAKDMAGYFRTTHGGAEQALFLQNNYEVLYDALCEIDPRGQIQSAAEAAQLLLNLKQNDITVVGLTSSPLDLSKKILHEAEIDPDAVFDTFIAYQRETPPLKMDSEKNIFLSIAQKYDLKTGQCIAIGDVHRYDIAPAEKIGMLTCHITDSPIDVASYHTPSATTVLRKILEDR